MKTTQRQHIWWLRVLRLRMKIERPLWHHIFFIQLCNMLNRRGLRCSLYCVILSVITISVNALQTKVFRMGLGGRAIDRLHLISRMNRISAQRYYGWTYGRIDRCPKRLIGWQGTTNDDIFQAILFQMYLIPIIILIRMIEVTKSNWKLISLEIDHPSSSTVAHNNAWAGKVMSVRCSSWIYP